MFRSVFKRRKDKEKPVEEVRMTDSPATKATKVYDAFKSQAPESIEPFLEKAAPWVVKLCVLLQEMAPLVTVAYDYWAQLVVLLDPYKVDLLLPAFVGIVLCFFGGSFLTLIAAVEAYRMCGYETSLDAMKSIKEDMDVFLEASKKDDAKDEDGNGIADVTEISGAQVHYYLYCYTLALALTSAPPSSLPRR